MAFNARVECRKPGCLRREGGRLVLLMGPTCGFMWYAHVLCFHSDLAAGRVFVVMLPEDVSSICEYTKKGEKKIGSLVNKCSSQPESLIKSNKNPVYPQQILKKETTVTETRNTRILV